MRRRRPYRIWVRCLVETHPHWEPLPDEYPTREEAERALDEICQDDSDLSGVALPAGDRPMRGES